MNAPFPRMSTVSPQNDPVVISAPPAAIPTTVATPSRSGIERLQSLDAYRGLIMVTLAFKGFGLAATAQNHLAANPDSGFWRAVYHQFEHVEWTGGGYWDLIQPSFMFMVGVSMAFSYLKRQREGQSWGRMFGHASWRAVVLIFLGIFLISNSRKSTEWMLTNVLTQIGLGYPFLFLLWGRSRKTHIITAAALLGGAWALYALYPTTGIDPAKGAPQVGVSATWAQQHLPGISPAWHKNANVGHAIDVAVLNALPRKEPFVFNVGGYQSINFVASLATMLFGLMVGEMLRSARPAGSKLKLLLIAGVAGLAGGLVLSWIGVPLVKRIWTPSWALYSTGWCCLILAALYGIIDLGRWRAWSFPLIVVGMNSIAIYCMEMLLKGWTGKTLQTHLGDGVFNIFGAMNAPFVQSTMIGLVFWLVCWWMYRRKIFLRI
jgi:heparan-alpha-glucosaminide N-acetyltransferase